MFLSLVIATNVNYRALTRLPDQRQFNVAMSRARDQVWLFHSVRQHDLGPMDLRRRLVGFFENVGHGTLEQHYENLDNLERQARSTRRRGSQPDPYDSWFEVDVALELLRRQFRIRPQVEVAGKRIDLVVDGIDSQLAVECDGDEWHGPERYESDMARQRQLERAGWTFVRVRGSDFYVDREATTRTIVDACEYLGVRPLDYVEDTRSPSSAEGQPGERSENQVASSGEEISPAGSDPEKEEGYPTDGDLSGTEHGPFAGYTEEMRFPDPRDSSAANVRAVLRQIIEKDGPLARSSVYRLYVRGFPGLQKVGKIVRQALNRALGAMLRAGEVVQEDELQDGSAEGQVMRLAGAAKVKVREAGNRDLLEIPPSELFVALRRLMPGDTEMPKEDETLFRELLERYGFPRLTKPRQEYLSKVLELLRVTDHETKPSEGASL